ncbi:GNAT family N-acetyltransferase [Solimonas sp. K1W22B-7]|uniref:GNAT family N-acetyltransferase n=1 Tax=Solimonas sp. K1W22B-7 TaxID=2303331 RepID=UPI000E334326|nr:GNAT family N-acetyltransferase [Solimonas sp. K1W22B-7]AXQ29614.1 GNAT family N-acetyltransferase [Solimonas sp. K1W22B-7]
MSEPTVELLRGADIARHLDALAQLRITVFREFPYLYEGSAEYETRYLQTYIDSPSSLVVLVRDGDRAVGASTSLPLAEAHQEMRDPFLAAGLPLEQYHYFGESLLLRPYRGRGLGLRFFEEREAHARELGLPWTTFCAVERPGGHPSRPPDYVPNDAFWGRRGYVREPALQCRLIWPDVGAASPSEKTLGFWRKRLDAA